MYQGFKDLSMTVWEEQVEYVQNCCHLYSLIVSFPIEHKFGKGTTSNYSTVVLDLMLLVSSELKF